MKHVLYRNLTKREKPDFIVKYKIIDKHRLEKLPFQGIRTDFKYAEDEGTNQAYMIYPEFRDEEGDIIMDWSRRILSEGIADMWIARPEMIDFHKSKLAIGKKGYFLEGTKKIAECEVIEIL